MTQKKSGKIVMKAWEDPAYLERLKKDAAKVLKEEGCLIPEGIEVKVVEDSEKVIYLRIPQKPSKDLSPEEMLNIAAGFKHCGGSCGI